MIRVVPVKAQVGLGQIGTTKLGVGQMGVASVRTDHRGVVEFGTLEHGLVEHRAGQVDTPQVGIEEISAPERFGTDCGRSEVLGSASGEHRSKSTNRELGHDEANQCHHQ